MNPKTARECIRHTTYDLPLCNSLLTPGEGTVLRLMRDLRCDGWLEMHKTSWSWPGNIDNPIDLLISDEVMPSMSGAKLASVLTAQRPEMRVFFVSGYPESTVLRHGNVDVAARLLQKPFFLRAMVRKVRKVLESHSAPTISVRAAGAAR